MLGSLALVGLSACTNSVTGHSKRVPPSSSAMTSTTSVLPEADVFTRQLERATFGVTADLRAQVSAAGGLSRWLDSQLDPGNLVPDKDSAALLSEIDSRFDTGSRSSFKAQDRSFARNAALETITGRTIMGAAFGADQLRQRVVGILSDLLHVSSAVQPEIFWICDYDQVLRDGAFGRFSDLLVAAARQPAMLSFLDQGTSRADGTNIPNENFAREVMELHTVGVDGGYDETDVVELAHVLSGWSMDRRSGAYLYRPEWHNPGPFETSGDILGWNPQNRDSGERLGEDALNYLAHHRSTARRLAHIFAKSLVSESIAADDDLVEESARIYLYNDTRIGPMVKHLLVDDRFATESTLMLRRPIDLVAHILRLTGSPKVSDLDTALPSLVGIMHVLGQVPYAWPAPNGFPTASAAWSNAGATISRWNAINTFVVTGTATTNEPTSSTPTDSPTEPLTKGGRSRGQRKGGSASHLGITLDPGSVGASGPDDLISVLCSPQHQVF